MLGPSAVADFVGRGDELAAFESAVVAARHGVPAVLLVGGDAGIGKSSLVREAARRLGVDLLVGRCLPMGGEVIPLAPVADLLRSVRRTDSEALAHQPAFAPLVAWLARDSGDSRGSVGAMFAPLLELLAVLGTEKAIIVTFEDLHWADPSTWDLFDFLARNLVDERVVLVGTYRANEIGKDPEARGRLGEVARLSAARRLQLGGLSREDITAQIEAVLGATPPADLVAEVFARSDGNPFFAGELVAARLAGQRLPPLVSDLITSDLQSLDRASRAVLAALAVVGRDASHELVARSAEVGVDELEPALRAVIDEQLVLVDGESDTYRVRHALIGEVVYDHLLPPERTRLHARVAAALADEAPHVLARADRAAELSFHLDRAGDHAAAFTALLFAADAAETVAPAAALRLLERALELWDVAGETSAAADRGGRLWQAAELSSGAVSNARAAELAREALHHGVPPHGAAWGHERLGRYLWGAGRIEESTAEFETAAGLLPDAPGPEAAVVFAGLAQADLMIGRYDTAEARAVRVFELLGQPDTNPPAWAMARRVLGIVVDHGGDPTRGTKLCREALEIAPNAQTRMLAVLYLGVALLDAGNYREVVNVMLDAAADARLTGLDRSFGGYVNALAAEGLLRLGRWPEAEALLVGASTEAFQLGAIRVGLVAATLAARRGDRDRAHMLLEEVRALSIDGFHRWFLDRAAAEISLALSDWADAAAVVDGVGIDDAPKLWRARFVMYRAIAEVELVLDARARREPCEADAIEGRLRRLIDDAREASKDPRGEIDAPDIAAHLAHAFASVTRLGNSDADAWAEAARRWADLDEPYWLAAARLREAEAAIADGATARAAAALQDAHKLAVRLGAGPLLAEIEAVSRRTRLSVEPSVAVTLDDVVIDRFGLTPRECEVLSLVAAGRTNRQIGEALFVSEKTASVHVSNILRKLEVSSRVDAAAIAQRLGV